MAITNQERVGKAMELLRAGLAPFVEREFKNLHQAQAADAARRYLATIGPWLRKWSLTGTCRRSLSSFGRRGTMYSAGS